MIEDLHCTIYVSKGMQSTCEISKKPLEPKNIQVFRPRIFALDTANTSVAVSPHTLHDRSHKPKQSKKRVEEKISSPVYLTRRY